MVFTLAYCLFEIPTGMMGDRLGPRRVLTRIVMWWSMFTTLTGAMTGYYPLLLTRFLFGAGEAGAFPNASVVVSRWFPPQKRATISGVNLMASQVGSAVAKLLVLPIQMRYGWRMSFYVFGVFGLVWPRAGTRGSAIRLKRRVAAFRCHPPPPPPGLPLPVMRSRGVWSRRPKWSATALLCVHSITQRSTAKSLGSLQITSSKFVQMSLVKRTARC